MEVCVRLAGIAMGAATCTAGGILLITLRVLQSQIIRWQIDGWSSLVTVRSSELATLSESAFIVWLKL